MIRHLSIRHFAIVEALDVDLGQGMTAITGETGAGKSIMLDALALVLGGRGDSSVVAAGHERAEIAVTVDLARYPAARQWLAEQLLEGGMEGGEAGQSECLLRRVLSREGRSQAWINGRPVTLQQLKALGSKLVDIHSQHEHQSLLQRDHHRHLLDAFGACESEARQLKTLYQEWRSVDEQIQQLSAQGDENNARIQLLRYQVEELDQLALTDGELQVLEQEQKELANAEDLLDSGQQLLALCEQGTNEGLSVTDLLNQALQLLGDQKVKTRFLLEAEQLLENARIQVQEATAALEQHQSGLELDPERLQEVEQRLGAIYQIARKHRIVPAELSAFHQSLHQELKRLGGGELDLSMLEARRSELAARYHALACRLGEQRKKAARALEKAIHRQLKHLNMGGSELVVELVTRPESLHPHGLEQVEFLIRTNPGQPLMPLRKVASGGELSRVSLAIQVVLAQLSVIPTLIFDEVDVGIGGDTAAVMGQLLHELGEKGQVICVTHQAAVAARAHQHISVSKILAKDCVKTALHVLGSEQRVEEVARMLGGAPNQASCAHARLMLQEGLRKAS